MTWPLAVNPTSGVDLVPVRGMWKNLDGTAKKGRVVFTAPRLVHATGTVIYPGGPMSVALDGTGSILVSIPASDDPDVLPAGWQTLVEEKLNDGSGRTYAITTPLGSLPTGVNLAFATIPTQPGPPVQPIYIVVPPGGTDGQVLVKDSTTPTGYRWATATAGGTPSAVSAFPSGTLYPSTILYPKAA